MYYHKDLLSMNLLLLETVNISKSMHIYDQEY